MVQTETIIIGAGPAGLAVSACLKNQQKDFILLERSGHVGNAWRNHYDRLHLHTDKRNSNLPFFPMPSSFPKYPSRDQVVQYLEDYAKHLNIEPVFHQEVTDAYLDKDDDLWKVETQDTSYVAKNLVVATSINGIPNIPTWPGLDSFDGEIIHSSAYKNGSAWKGEKVLVVGFGNSGGEIAIDLVERGTKSFISVRSPVNVIPKELFGIPILSITRLAMLFPAALSDFLFAPLLKFMYGRLYKLGLRKSAIGPTTQVIQKGKIPLLDIGTAKLIKSGDIKVKPGITSIKGKQVTFTDGTTEEFEAIVAATGYKSALDRFLRDASQVTNEVGNPTDFAKPTSLRGLYFCGFYVAPTGMLRELGIEAKKIAKHISK